MRCSGARYDRDLERFEREGGYTLAPRIDAVLHGLGFDPDQARTRALAGLSGGERGRVGLAQQLVAPADVLLLDEPTNHLDLETTRWLEDYLAQLDATVLLISHDRAFLQAVVDHVLHVEAVRVPIFRYLLNRPIRSDFFQNFQVAAFGDLGTAWTGRDPYASDNSFNTQVISRPPITISIKNQREPIVGSYGFGLRSRLLGYFVRADWAWGVDDGRVLPHVFHFSLALDI